MGFFDNIIADSRIPLRNTLTPAYAATGPLGETQNLEPAEDVTFSSTEGPPEDRAVEASIQFRDVSADPPLPTVVPVDPTLPTAVSAESRSVNDVDAIEATQPSPIPADHPTPMTRRPRSTPETDTGETAPDALGQHPVTSTQAPADRRSASEAPISANVVSGQVQRQALTPDAGSPVSPIGSNFPPLGGPVADDPASSFGAAMADSAPVPWSTTPGQAMDAVNVVPSEQRPQIPAPLAPDVQSSTRFIGTGDASVASVGTESAVPATPLKTVLGRQYSSSGSYEPAAATWSFPLDSARMLPSGSQSSLPRAPQVRIGEVNVIVEGSDVPRAPSPPTTAENLTSRLYLRSL